jgi:agmatinase
VPIDLSRPGQPSYAGIPTFSDLPFALEASDLEGADVVILGAPIDETVVHRPGTRFGPRAIRAAGYGGGFPTLELGVSPFEELTMVDYGDAAVVPADAARSHEALRGSVREIVGAGALPVILGGDHSIAHPDVGAMADVLGAGRVGVIHFDAHADNAPDMYGVVYRSHGTPMRLLVEEGSVRGEDVVQVGLRGYWPGPQEFDWARSKGFRWHLMEEIHERGIREVTSELIRGMGHVEHVFLSVDIDGCDPAFAPGTGAPEPGGLGARDLLWSLRTIASSLPLAGMELVEVSPPYDHAEITALLAHRAILEVLSGVALRRKGIEPRPQRDDRGGQSS